MTNYISIKISQNYNMTEIGWKFTCGMQAARLSCQQQCLMPRRLESWSSSWPPEGWAQPQQSSCPCQEVHVTTWHCLNPMLSKQLPSALTITPHFACSNLDNAHSPSQVDIISALLPLAHQRLVHLHTMLTQRHLICDYTPAYHRKWVHTSRSLLETLASFRLRDELIIH